QQFGHESEIEDATFWPRHSLPKAVPNTRIFTWGYDADIDGFRASASQNTVHQHAGNLLSDLSDLRTTPEEVHYAWFDRFPANLGGIIVKDALNQSRLIEGTRLKEITSATFAVLFLGTPHRGSRTASLGRIVYKTTIIATKRPNVPLLRALEKNAETLDRIGDGFSQTMLKYKIQVYSFREEKETRKYVFFNKMVVEADSAKIGDAQEEIGSIPTNHQEMTKFSTSQDVGLKRISAQLRRWIGEVKSISAGTHISSDDLESLNLAETKLRMNQVEPEHADTCHWLYDSDTVSFVDWLQSPDLEWNRPYWIQGKPGSGKSTLMKFAMSQPKTIELLGKDRPGLWTLVGFFFHDRGMTRNPKPEWDLESLKSTLKAVLWQDEVDAQFCLFLDALDEHGGENSQLVDLVNNVILNGGSSPKFNVKIKVCIASRPWPIFQQHFGACPGLCIHEHTEKDIKTYVTDRLGDASNRDQPLLDAKQLSMLTKQIVSKAFGVFIWVRLVVDQLVIGVRDGTTFFALMDEVEKIPPELEDLYRHTLRRIEPKYSSETFIMLEIILCSLKPLDLTTFIECVNHVLARCVLPQRLPKLHDMEWLRNDSFASKVLRLASRSGGLLENVPVVSSTTIHAEPPEIQVQFIHQTAKEFIEKSRLDLGLRDWNQELSKVAIKTGHEFLLIACGSWAPWVETIKPNIFTYAKLTDEHVRANTTRRADYLEEFDEIFVAKDRFTEMFDFDWWTSEFEGWNSNQKLKVKNLISYARNFGEPSSMPFAVANNLVSYVESGALFQTAPWDELMNFVELSHLELSVRYGDASSVRLLLGMGIKPDSNLIKYAEMRGDKSILRALKDYGVEFPVIDRNEVDLLGVRALSMAMGHALAACSGGTGAGLFRHLDVPRESQAIKRIKWSKENDL
ncbi:MAG: hypothetical protein Q9167_007408, partial [Letrouitia subvulpina]